MENQMAKEYLIDQLFTQNDVKVILVLSLVYVAFKLWQHMRHRFPYVLTSFVGCIRWFECPLQSFKAMQPIVYVQWL